MSVSTIHAGRPNTYADRRRAVAERLARTAGVAEQLETTLSVPDDEVATSSADPDGVLRSAVRALLAVAYRTPGFDVTVALGPANQWAAHIVHGPEGVTAELIDPRPPAPERAAAPPRQGGSPESAIAELAAWLWTGEVAR